MCQKPPSQSQKNSQNSKGQSPIEAMLRRLTLFKKAVIRLVRRCYPSRSQYPDDVLQFEQWCARLHAWLRTYGRFWSSSVFQRLLTEFLQTLRQRYGKVQSLCSPETTMTGKKSKKGKKGKKAPAHARRRLIANSVDALRRCSVILTRPLRVHRRVRSVWSPPLRKRLLKHCGRRLRP